VVHAHFNFYFSFIPFPAIRHAPFGTTISKRAPFPGSPVSRMVMPVMSRISRESARPRPVFF
jgi:hypothetical protein